ncbi:hypothetical protein L7F22_049357 [Adiantum nelumboides]|nr:hypothetical protein [Adiantum nelumboides]
MGDHLSSGGVCISVGSRWLARVLDHGTLIPGKAMWITLQCDASVVGVLCIYAPTTATERSWFWDQIDDVLPSVDSWIVGGDFNNLETFEDWRADQPPALLHIARCGRDAWDRFLFAIAGMDAWYTPSFAHVDSSLHFSWGFHRQRGLLLKCLDRFYVGNLRADSGGIISIMPDTSLSDHAPVSLCAISRGSSASRWGSRPRRFFALSQIWTCGSSQMQDPGATTTATAYQVSPTESTASDNDLNNSTIFVGGLDPMATEADLRNIFTQFGELVYVKIPVGKGCGFVQFMHRSCAEEALQRIHGTVIGQQAVRLSWGRSPVKTQGFGWAQGQVDPSQTLQLMPMVLTLCMGGYPQQMMDAQAGAEGTVGQAPEYREEDKQDLLALPDVDKLNIAYLDLHERLALGHHLWLTTSEIMEEKSIVARRVQKFCELVAHLMLVGASLPPCKHVWYAKCDRIQQPKDVCIMKGL